MITLIRTKFFSSLVGLAVLLSGWAILTETGFVSGIVLPTPQAVLAELWYLLHTGSFGVDIETSLKEFVLGFVIGSAIGLVGGIILGQIKRFRILLMPSVQILRFIVPFSLIPLATLWFGFSIYGKVFIVAWAVAFVVVIATYGAIDNVNPLLLEAAAMLGIGGIQLSFRIIIPAAIGSILAGLRVAIAIGWVSVIAAEYLGSTAGLGWLITNAQANLDTKEIMAGMAVIGILGATMSWLATIPMKYIRTA